MPPTNEITRLLLDWGSGDAKSLECLLPLVYEELRRLAAAQMRRERDDHTLQPTALVHEAFLRLSGLREIQWRDRAQFFGSAARIMRRILVDHARKHRAAKRGGGHKHQLDDGLPLTDDQARELSDLDDALHDLEQLDPRQSLVVELRYFGGLSVPETAEALSISPSTVKREWAVARAWLQDYVHSGGGL